MLSLVPGRASAVGVELRDAELIAAGEPVLENSTGTVRLESPRLGHLGAAVFVPEPGAGLQVGWGAALLAAMARHRRSRGFTGTED